MGFKPMNTSLSVQIGIIGIVFGTVFVPVESIAGIKEDGALMAEVKKYIVNYFESQENFSSSYLITREQTEPLFVAFRRQGWDSRMLESFASRMVSSKDFLARELDSPEGRKFMERIAKYPQGYDRLDRLSRLPLGQQTVHDMIYKVGGDEMIEYLTTSAGGTEMGKMLSQAPRGAGFNKPTGRIYTLPMLVAAFREKITREK
jgi:hypothetical protein